VERDETLKIMTLAMRAGEVMLESSVSVSEVEQALRRITTSFGLAECEVSITLRTITLSYVSYDLGMPFTLMRTVESREPQLNRLVALEGLSRRIERGECALADADRELEEIRTLPNPYPLWSRFAAGLVAAAAWTLFSSGNFYSAAAAMVAAALAVPMVYLVSRSRVPEVFASFVAALLVVAVPYAAAWADIPVRVAPAVVGGLIPLLPGYALVASVVDGLSGAPLSSVAKGLQAIVVATALALGVLAAIKAAEFFEIVPVNDDHHWPAYLIASCAAAGLASLSFARGTPLPALAPTVLLGVAAWFVLWSAPGANIGSQVATFAGATLVGLGGVIAARVQRSAATVYTSIAILVLVPGFTIYLAMFSFGQGLEDAGIDLTIEALGMALAIAAGVALGAAIGSSVPRPRPPMEMWRRSRQALGGGSVA
jgi:uncharacterized membrane protein YjjP (DUF1212 family)